MKVVLFMVGLEPGGGSVYVVRLAQELIRQGIEVKVVSLRCLESTPLIMMGRNIPWECLGMRSLYDLGIIIPIISKLRQFKPDVVHTNHPIDAVVGNLAARFIGIPCVTTVHSLLNHISLAKPDAMSRFLAYQRYFWSEWLAAKFANTIIAVSKPVREELINSGISHPSKVKVIYQGIDLEQFHPSRFASSKAKSLSVGCVSRLSPEKGIEYFIEMALKLSERHPNVRFRLVGGVRNRVEQLYLEKCKTILKNSGKKTLVDFLGHQLDIPYQISQMDVVVVPSLTEGFGLSVVEAMAMEKPVVATSVGGIPEIVQDGETGFLVEPGNVEAMVEVVDRLLEDTLLRRQIGHKARERVENTFSLKQMVEQTLLCYESII